MSTTRALFRPGILLKEAEVQQAEYSTFALRLGDCFLYATAISANGLSDPDLRIF